MEVRCDPDELGDGAQSGSERSVVNHRDRVKRVEYTGGGNDGTLMTHSMVLAPLSTEVVHSPLMNKPVGISTFPLNAEWLKV